MEREAELRGECADEGFIGIGIGAAEFVVDVQDGGGEVELMEGCEEED